MTLPGETIATGASPICPDCKKEVEFEVLRSAGGFYVGTACQCGPYSRESGYYRTYDEAEQALSTGGYHRF